MQASYGIENNFSPAAIGNLAQYPKPYFSDSKTLIFLLRAICGSSCSFAGSAVAVADEGSGQRRRLGVSAPRRAKLCYSPNK